jgi:hypothetical protein
MYRVTVRVPGYREWTARHVLVRYKEPCRLKPTVLTARLQPEE